MSLKSHDRDLYIVGAGIKPESAIPICLDLGTSTKNLIDDPLYLGLRRDRPSTAEVCVSIGPMRSLWG
jgi:malate dehydrogenase (oxaloacetate-decarboxylating)(NADP+)